MWSFRQVAYRKEPQPLFPHRHGYRCFIYPILAIPQVHCRDLGRTVFSSLDFLSLQLLPMKWLFRHDFISLTTLSGVIGKFNSDRRYPSGQDKLDAIAPLFLSTNETLSSDTLDAKIKFVALKMSGSCFPQIRRSGIPCVVLCVSISPHWAPTTPHIPKICVSI